MRIEFAYREDHGTDYWCGIRKGAYPSLGITKNLVHIWIMKFNLAFWWDTKRTDTQASIATGKHPDRKDIR